MTVLIGTTKDMAPLPLAIRAIQMFTFLYRNAMGMCEYRTGEPPVSERDGTTHEMIFEHLVWMQPGEGSDWHLVMKDLQIADDVLRHIFEERYEHKKSILSQLREAFPTLS